uniref:Uncharacterized protein n=1 Tax=Paramormyrops kingsleyae TaxID=1676925 RepID=A0A3B3S307_9TELE
MLNLHYFGVCSTCWSTPSVFIELWLLHMRVCQGLMIQPVTISAEMCCRCFRFYLCWKMTFCGACRSRPTLMVKCTFDLCDCGWLQEILSVWTFAKSTSC